MKKKNLMSNSEWMVMECLWKRESTLMELVQVLEKSVGWSKSTVATLLRRMEEKGLVGYKQEGRAKLFYPMLSLTTAADRETDDLLERLYDGSAGQLLNALVRRNRLRDEDICQMYEMLRKAEENRK